MVAGALGLHRVVQRLNVMTVPDILPWVKENEFLLATGYPLPSTAAELAALVSALDARGLAALGVKLGSYLEALPREMLQRADQLAFPIIDIPQHVGFDDILSQALTDIVNRQSAVLERAEEIHRVFMRIVLEGGGLPEITEKPLDDFRRPLQLLASTLEFRDPFSGALRRFTTRRRLQAWSSYADWARG